MCQEWESFQSIINLCLTFGNEDCLLSATLSSWQKRQEGRDSPPEQESLAQGPWTDLRVPANKTPRAFIKFPKGCLTHKRTTTTGDLHTLLPIILLAIATNYYSFLLTPSTCMCVHNRHTTRQCPLFIYPRPHHALVTD